VLGAVDPGVHALGQAGVDLPGEAPQAGGVGLGHVGEPRQAPVVGRVGTGERRPAGEVDVVGDEHRLPDPEALPETAGGVGEHHGAAAGGDGGADAVHDGGQVVALIGVD